MADRGRPTGPRPVLSIDGEQIRKPRPGLYIARLVLRDYPLPLSNRIYPKAQSSIINIGTTNSNKGVWGRWAANDKSKLLDAHKHGFFGKHGNRTPDAVRVDWVPGNAQAEQHLIRLFLLAVGAYPLLQRERGMGNNVWLYPASYRQHVTETIISNVFMSDPFPVLKRMHDVHKVIRDVNVPRVALRLQRVLCDHQQVYHLDHVGEASLQSWSGERHKQKSK